MRRFLAADVVYHLPGRHLGGGTLSGRGEIFQRTARAASACESPPAIELIDVVASREFVVSLERFRARRARKVLDQVACVVWRIAAGRCVEIWSHFSDQPACDAFWDGWEPE